MAGMLKRRKSLWSSRWLKAGLVFGLFAIWIGLYLVGTATPNKVKVYVRNVGCEARGFRLGKWSYDSGPQITIANDGIWIYLGKYDADSVEFQMFGPDGRATYGRGLGTGYYRDWGLRNVVTVTILEKDMVVIMRRGPPKPVSPTTTP